MLTTLIVAFAFGCHDGGTLADAITDTSVSTDVEPPTPDIRVIKDARIPDAAPPDMIPIWEDAGPDVMVADVGVGDALIDARLPDMMPDGGIDPICEDQIVLPEQPPIDLNARCRGQGEPLRIRDLRDSRCFDYQVLPTQQPGRQVDIPEAIVTAVYDGDFTVQDPEGGAYSALWVFTGEQVVPAGIQPGARVRLRGQLLEFFTLTELVPGDNGIEVMELGEIPEPLFVADSSQLEAGAALAEPLENVLLEIHAQRVTQTAPDCPRDFGMFIMAGAALNRCVSDASAAQAECNQACENPGACLACDDAFGAATEACPKGLRIDDQAPFDYEPARGDLITRIVGTLHFSFERQKLLPRGDADIESTPCGGLPDKCEDSECPVLADAPETGPVIITEIQSNPNGPDELGEFVEIYNASPDAIDLTNWVVQDCAGNIAPLSGMIAPWGYKVLARELDSGVNGGVDADFGFADFFLPNAFGTVLVFDADNVLVDQVRYAPGDEIWPHRAPGHSMELIEHAADNRLGNAWSEARQRYGRGGWGSPGARRPGP